ncbi:MAG: HEAT repeat domain-containing protein [Vicinamibacterales bacterium]
MLSLDVLSVAMALEGALIACALGGLALLRMWLVARAHRVEAGVAALEPQLHHWLVEDTPPDAIVRALRALPTYVAFRSVARLATGYLTFERQQRLAPLLRHETWVREVLDGGDSLLWWRRFDAARLLSIVGGPDDAPLVASLLADTSPAVRLVAIDAAARLGGVLVDLELSTLPSRQDAVQQYQYAALARHAAAIVPAVDARLTPLETPQRLTTWIDAAAALAHPAALWKVRDLALHPDANVRLHVARALRRQPEPETVPVLLRLLQDEDWRVRAQAARALGALRATSAALPLAKAVRDRAWWVRYRSALALAQIGGSARGELLMVARGDDLLARDMARLVAGLSSAAVVEMSEV